MSRKILLDNIDQEISRTFNDINNQYNNYLTDKDNNLHSFIIKVNENKTIRMSAIFGTTLLILTKLYNVICNIKLIKTINTKYNLFIITFYINLMKNPKDSSLE